MRRNDKAPDRRKVEDLKDKAKRDVNRSEPVSGATVQTVLYGPHTENQKASGQGEYDT